MPAGGGHDAVSEDDRVPPGSHKPLQLRALVAVVVLGVVLMAGIGGLGWSIVTGPGQPVAHDRAPVPGPVEVLPAAEPRESTPLASEPHESRDEELVAPAAEPAMPAVARVERNPRERAAPAGEATPELAASSVMAAVPLEPAPAQPGAAVSFTGDATKVFLMQGNQRHALPGNVPAGSYDIEAVFPNRGHVRAGKVWVIEGTQVRLHCQDLFGRCSAE